jgi:hypothetical protein
MSDRINLLESALINVKAYTKHTDGWRPGLVDLFVYDYLMQMHEEDEENLDIVWTDTPDHIIEAIMNSGFIFDLEFGSQDLWEALRDYLNNKGYTKSTEEEEE